MNHPTSCKDSTCGLSYRDHLTGIHISADATPNRKPKTRMLDGIDKKFAKDAAAYKSLRKQGYQPPHVDGAHELVQKIATESDIKPLGEHLFQKHQRSTNVGTGINEGL